MDLQHSCPAAAEEDDFESWCPLLDEALGKLVLNDREAILLRFFRGKSLADIGTTFGVSEDAAQKRLARALERLRGHFCKRGVKLSSAALAAGLVAAGSQAAPAGLASAIAAGSIAVSSAAAGGCAAFCGKLASSMELMKTKLALMALTAVTVTTPLVLQQSSLSAARAERAALQTQAAALPQLQAEQERLQTRKNLAEELRQLEAELPEVTALRERVAKLQSADIQAKLEWQQRLHEAQRAWQAAQVRTAGIRAQVDAKELGEKRIHDMKQIGLAARVWATDNADKFPDRFVDMTNELGEDFDVSPYEFMPQPRPVSETEPEMILFRERVPRQLPDGTWQRNYTFADGSVQTITRKGGNFEDFEDHQLHRAGSARGDLPAGRQVEKILRHSGLCLPAEASACARSHADRSGRQGRRPRHALRHRSGKR